MAERPLLALREAVKARRQPSPRPHESVPGISAARQSQRGVGQKLDRLSRDILDPAQIAALQDDPNAIVPERALVFEVKSLLTDVRRALNAVDGLEFLGEVEEDADYDEDFGVVVDGVTRPDKKVPRRIYFTIPSDAALRKIVALWNKFKRGEQFDQGEKEWRKVFEHLADVRRWGPKDRLTDETIENWKEQLRQAPEEPVRFEVEFWYRSPAKREGAERIFATELARLGGTLHDRADIQQISYLANLVEVPSTVVRELIANREIGLAAKFDDIMILRPQSVVGEPLDDAGEGAQPVSITTIEGTLGAPIAALFDGLPMAGHGLLQGRLTVEDPDDFASSYGLAGEQIHGTAMASLIVHGDLNHPQPPVRRQLYVRPVMFPQPVGLDKREERMPPNRLGVDLIWQAFRRMLEGEGDAPASAAGVRIVNLSLGDATRQFAGVMSPWARLIDYLAWEHGLLILISAGNVTDPIPIPEIATWSDFETATPSDRQTRLLSSLLAQRATRRLLSPSEAINALTIGACHDDNVGSNGGPVMAIAPYANPHLPNPSSALGLGFQRSVKPELLFPGGREQVRSSTSHAPIAVRPVGSPNIYFGIKAAVPGQPGQTNKAMPHSGTSVATALATNSAIRILEALQEIPSDPAYPEIEEAFHGVILKALLVHGAEWDDEAVEVLKGIIDPQGNLHHEHVKAEIARLLGYGRPNIDRVLDCAASRATLLGWGVIKDGEADRFRVPLPGGLQGIRGFRAVTITIGWITPLNPFHRMYRKAKLNGGPGADKKFSLGIDNAQTQPSHNAVGRGTIFHRRWEGTKAAPFVDNGDLVFDVSCKATAGDLDMEIPYGVALTIEVGEGVAVQVYDEIRASLRNQVRVTNPA